MIKKPVTRKLCVTGFFWSAVGSTPLFVRSARLSLKPESCEGERQSGGKPTALHKITSSLLLMLRRANKTCLPDRDLLLLLRSINNNGADDDLVVGDKFLRVSQQRRSLLRHSFEFHIQRLYAHA